MSPDLESARGIQTIQENKQAIKKKYGIGFIK
jgi:hypothetical protein